MNANAKIKANKTSNGGNAVTTFTASGTFTASNNTNEVDVLVLAGGGSGGGTGGGAGGGPGALSAPWAIGSIGGPWGPWGLGA